MKNLLVFILLFFWIPCAFAITKIDVDSDNNQKVDGAAEAVSDGWNSDVDAPQKNDLHDYFIISDTDLDGSYSDEAWLTGAYQPLDSDLTDVAALTTTPYGLALLEVADEAALKELINLEIGTDVQAHDADTAKTDVAETVTESWTFDDGSGVSPGLYFEDGHDESWYMFKNDESTFTIRTSTADTETLDISNQGAGVADVDIDGAISEGGTSLVSKYEGIDAAIVKSDEAETITANWALLMYRLTAQASEPASVEVFDIVRANNDDWDPAGIGGTDDYLAICTSTGPSVWKIFVDQSANIYASGIQLAVTTVTSGPHEVTTAQSYGGWLVVEAAIDVDLPDCNADTVGMNLCVEQGDASEVVSVAVGDSDNNMLLSGTLLGVDCEIDSPGGAGDRGAYICLICTESDLWRVKGREGTWVDGGDVD